MEPIVLWQQKWGASFHIPWYLFLGGLAGGAMALGGLAELVGGRRERLRELARAAAQVTVPAIALGGLSLALHLGKPERGFAFPLFFTNYGSWLTIGGWIVGLFAPLSVALAAAWHFRLPRRVRLPLAVAGIPLGLAMALYTGWLLSGAWLVPGGRWFVPLWDATYLPLLFLLSGCSSALAACGLVALVPPRHKGVGAAVDRTQRDRVASLASAVDAATLLVEGAWLYLFLTALADGPLGARLAVAHVTRGALAPWFWWGVVAAGLAAPLALGALHALARGRRGGRWILAAEFGLVLVGALVLRYVVVWGGDLKTPLPFPPSLWPLPPGATG